MISRLAATIRALTAILLTPIAFLAFITVAAAVMSVIWLLAARPRRPPSVAGIWTGNLGECPLRLVLHVTTDSAGKLKLLLDSVDEDADAMGLPANNVVLEGFTFSFNIPDDGAKYQGTVSADGNTLDGIWNQEGFQITIPLVFTRTTAAAAPTPEPIAARPPVALENLKPILDQELKPVLERGLLSKPSGGGLVIGVLDHGERRIFAYGAARPNSIFEIGSITKTFTGLILAQMVVQKKVCLNEPVRALLPPGFAGPPSPHEITLLDLATQHSGLPWEPDNLQSWFQLFENPSKLFADYDARRLGEYLTRHGLAKPPEAKFLYSNLGFGLLGYALPQRANMSYAQLVQTEITGPLHMPDTVVMMSPAQRKRFIQGYDDYFDRADPLDLGVLAGAGALKSTASDMLTYLDANLHPEKYATGALAFPAATLPAAVALDHESYADLPGGKIALAWWINPKPLSLGHDGGTFGYTSFARFNPGQDWAVIVLYNRSPFNPVNPTDPSYANSVGQNAAALLSGKPALPVLDFMCEADKSGLARLGIQ